jgi:uncharacterized damage-inducible protein DinB
MADLKKTASDALAKRYARFGAGVNDLAAPLSEEQFWAKPFSFGNSFGHLVLHLTGNLNYYIGAQIANTGYQRDRPREFAETAPPGKLETLAKFDEAIAMVLRTIASQTEQDWSAPYQAAGMDGTTRFEALLQCATHVHHHIGQMMYLCFALKS